MEIKYGSVCSGIEAATTAWHPLGMKAVWFAEIEQFPSAVLAHHYPKTQNLGDMTRLATMVLGGKIEAPDVLVGGTPCQAFSVGGMREGLSDPRGALTIKYVELADANDYVRAGRGLPASIIVWENVPGVLSDKGNAFGCFLGALAGEDCELQPSGKRWPDAGCVYGPQRTIAWRVLDAQHFGLAQRRRRVFVVASARDGFDPFAVLFEREGVRRDDPPRRSSPTPVCLTARGAGSLDDRETYIVEEGGRVRHMTPLENERQQGFPDNYTKIPWPVTTDSVGRQCAKQVVRATVKTAKGRYFVSSNYTERSPDGGCPRSGMATGRGYELCREVCGQHSHAEINALRLAGPNANGATLFIEGHTYACEPCRQAASEAGIIEIVIGAPPVDGCPDGPRYKALGNSKAVPVIRWIGDRILKQLEQ